ncbi:Histidine phosphotransferase ChpT C-terminal domain-containing protein [Sphingomonas antarctica]|uniref:histidine phosphotransferase family protein n=1 Tax=Sphingomonas antarctica TaxID=2040274 RepID=UPI0039E7F59E
MTSDPIDLASLFCSRLCHDLLSPVGAMANGLELLADENDDATRGQIMGLLGDSARVSANKLKFFRLAFGAAGGFGDRVDTGEARSAIEGLLTNDGKIAVDWLVEDASLDKAAIKVMLNLALLAGEALVRGGRVAVGAETGGNTTELVIRAEGARLVLDPEVAATLTGGHATPTPKLAPAWLVNSLTAASGGHAQVVSPEDGVLLFGATLGRV